MVRQVLAFAGWSLARRCAEIVSWTLMFVFALGGTSALGMIRAVDAPASVSRFGDRSVVVEVPASKGLIRLSRPSSDQGMLPMPKELPRAGEGWYVRERADGWVPKVRVGGGTRLLGWLQHGWVWALLLVVYAATVVFNFKARRRSDAFVKPTKRGPRTSAEDPDGLMSPSWVTSGQ